MEGIFVVSEGVLCTFVFVKSYQCYSQVISRDILTMIRQRNFRGDSSYRLNCRLQSSASYGVCCPSI